MTDASNHVKFRRGDQNAAGPIGVALITAAAAGVGFVISKFRGSNKDAYKEALILKFNLEPAPCPFPPKSPLPLTGRTFVIKDNIHVAGYPTTFGCRAWDTSPANETAPCVQVLLEAGARGVGKANLEELTCSPIGANDAYGKVLNPAAQSLIPGGSSSGSAVAVGAEMADFALGTDTAGSVRIPAGCCGVFGMKPTFDAIDIQGVLPLASSFDTVGWFAKDAALLRQVGKVLLKEDISDSPEAASKFLIADDFFQICQPEDYAKILSFIATTATTKLLGPSNVAHVKVTNFLDKQCPELKEFKKKMKNSSANQGEKNGKKSKEPTALDALHYVSMKLVTREVCDSFGDWYKNADKTKIGSTTIKVLEHSMSMQEKSPLTVDETQLAEAAIQNIKSAFNDALSKGKILVLPTLAMPPLKRDSVLDADTRLTWQENVMKIMALASLAGLPQASIPLGMSKIDLPGVEPDKKGIPLSISLIGASGSDMLVLDTVHALYPLLKKAFKASPTTFKKENGVANGGTADVVMSLKEQGNNAFRSGQFFEAVQYYSQALQFDQKMPVLYSNRAMAYLKLGNFVEAEQDCSTSLSIDPKNVKALLRRGTARAYLAQFQEALSDFERVLEVEPTNAQAAQEIGRIQSAFSTPVDVNQN